MPGNEQLQMSSPPTKGLIFMYVSSFALNSNYLKVGFLSIEVFTEAETWLIKNSTCRLTRP